MNSLVEYLIMPIIGESTYKPGIVLLPGAFKPPTEGHFNLVKELARDPRTKELIIIISAGQRENIGPEESEKIWKIYLKYLPSNVKVMISPESSPVKAAYNIIKNNPETHYLIAVGYRDEKDKKDIDRIKSSEKYPNAEGLVYKTTSTIRATAARKELDSNNQEGFNEYLPSQLTSSEKDKVWNILTKPPIQESDRKGIKAFSREIITTNESQPKDFSFSLEGGWLLKNGLLSLTNFMIENGVNIKPLPRVVLIEDDKNNASNILGKTAYYNPQNKSIVLYTLNRHPIDIMKSFCHEMWHHHQNLEGRLNNINTTNTNEDDYLNKIEKETYLNSQIIYRNWADKMRKLNND
jgi:hypothetical protein